MRRLSELIYTLAFFGCGMWAIVSSTGTLFSGLEDTSLTGTWACALMVIIAFSLKVFGDVGSTHTKTLAFVGLTALLGGIWGLGTILVILAGILMITRGFKQIKVLREQTSIRDLREIRRKKLDEVKDEEVVHKEKRTSEEPTKPSVSEELLKGFVGSEDHKRKIQTWIDSEEFDKEELTPAEIRAKAKQEIRQNNLSLETVLALEELEKSYENGSSTEEKDLTYVSLDLESDEVEEERYSAGLTPEDTSEEEDSNASEDTDEEEDDTKPTPPTDEMMEMSIEDLFGD